MSWRRPGRVSAARAAAGLSLVELVLAMAITAVVALAIAAMLSATSYGTDTSRDMRELAVRGKTLCSRINEAVRQADRVLAAGDDYLVLWADHDGDGLVGVHELMRIEWDEDERAVLAWSAADNAPAQSWPTDANFDAITTSLKASAAFPARQWASDVAQWQLALDDDPADARLVSYRLRLATGRLEDVTVNAAALRNR